MANPIDELFLMSPEVFENARDPNLGTSRGLTVGSLYLREPNRGTLCRLTVAPIYELSIDFVGTSYQICKTQTNIYMNICVLNTRTIQNRRL